mmetsp:Transcript_4616/g.6070  ORF Transcript_4616/g.6070 Transcript_4616/m.6070 type:complete len:208 (+) Transcript_4616:27-650(+)
MYQFFSSLDDTDDYEIPSLQNDIADNNFSNSLSVTCPAGAQYLHEDINSNDNSTHPSTAKVLSLLPAAVQNQGTTVMKRFRNAVMQIKKMKKLRKIHITLRERTNATTTSGSQQLRERDRRTFLDAPDFFQQIHEYKALNGEAQYEKCLSIIQTYIVTDSPHKIDFSSEVQQHILLSSRHSSWLILTPQERKMLFYEACIEAQFLVF